MYRVRQWPVLGIRAPRESNLYTFPRFARTHDRIVCPQKFEARTQSTIPMRGLVRAEIGPKKTPASSRYNLYFSGIIFSIAN